MSAAAPSGILACDMATIPLIRDIVLAGPRGFCAGVDRAIDIVELALQVCPPPIYVRKEIVHNRHVVEALRAKGAHFVDELDEVPDDATARGAWDALTAEFPGLAEYTKVISCAVNEEYASFDRRLKDGDEVAFLPPVSGG